MINRHDVVFWLGDLNYRLQPLEDLDQREAMLETVCREIDRQNWEQLVEYDQLKQQQRLGLVLAGFEEEALCFPPTFKFGKTPDAKDAKSRYNTKRVPSYCDRILYRATGDARVECKAYTCESSVTSIDHRPVLGSFDITVPVVVPSKRVTLGRPRNLRLEIRNLILRTEASHNPCHETEQPVTVTMFHRFANTRINTAACTSRKRVWDGPFVLESTAELGKVLLHPVLFLIRDRSQRDPKEHCLGEGMLSLHDLSSRAFKTDVYQGGKPYGLLAGQVEFSFV